MSERERTDRVSVWQRHPLVVLFGGLFPPVLVVGWLVWLAFVVAADGISWAVRLKRLLQTPGWPIVLAYRYAKRNEVLRQPNL